MSRALRALFLALVRLYYPRRRVENAAAIPATGPVVVVANHPNGLLDPVVLQLGLGTPVRFLAKSTLFGNPLGRLAMAAFGCIPVFRSQDVGAGAGRRDRNQETFAICRAALAAGDWLALFPEGTSHSDPRLRPLKTGAARIAISAAGEIARAAGAGGRLPVLLPVGLGYEAKAVFRSGVLIHVGQPIPVPAGDGEDQAAVDRLTTAIRTGLGAVVLEAETRELLEGIARVALWTGADAANDPAAHHRRTRELLAAYELRRARDPATVETITRAARDYARVLQHLGVRDPWGLEVVEVPPARVLQALVRLLVTAPLAAVGAALAWIPYRLAGPVAARIVGRELDVLGTVKLLAGSLFIAIAWAAEIAIAWRLGGRLAGLGLALAAPITGYAALRFEEILRETAVGLRHLWLRRAHASKVERVAARRRALADAVAEALARPLPPLPAADEADDDDPLALPDRIESQETAPQKA